MHLQAKGLEQASGLEFLTCNLNFPKLIFYITVLLHGILAILANDFQTISNKNYQYYDGLIASSLKRFLLKFFHSNTYILNL